MTTTELVENIILNENAYFFQKSQGKFLAKRLIENTFKEIINLMLRMVTK